MTESEYIENLLKRLHVGDTIRIPYLLLNAPSCLKRYKMRKYLKDNYERFLSDGYHFGGCSRGVVERNKQIKLPVHYIRTGGIWRTYIQRVRE